MLHAVHWAESDSASTSGTNDQWSRWKVDLSSLKQQEILLDQKTHPDYFWKTIIEKLPSFFSWQFSYSSLVCLWTLNILSIANFGSIFLNCFVLKTGFSDFLAETPCSTSNQAHLAGLFWPLKKFLFNFDFLHIFVLEIKACGLGSRYRGWMEAESHNW